MKTTHTAILASLAVALVGCATGNVNSSDPTPSVITLNEIREANASTVYDLVRNRHPNWLRKRGRTSIQNPGPIVVYVENARIGGPDALRQISTTGITAIEFLDAAEAQLRFGSGHNHGAIIISR